MTKKIPPSHSHEYPLVLFTSKDGAVTVPTRLERDTLWLTQDQMAQVFDVKRPAITKHLSNIFKTQELDEESTCSILEHTAADGKTDQAQFYNLIAESKPAERELMVNLVMVFLAEDNEQLKMENEK